MPYDRYDSASKEPQKQSFWFTTDGDVRWGRVAAIIVTTLVLIVLFFMTIYTVPAGSVGVITRWGAVNRVVYAGLGVKIPVAERVVKMSIRTQKDQVDSASASKDLQTVTSTIAVNYHLDGQYAVNVFESVGQNYQDILLAPAIQNIFKATTAQFTAEQLITNREAVRLQAEDALAKQLAVYHIVVENFNIVNFDFSPEFNAAIEKKQVAQQEVETSKQKLAQAKIDAETVITAAQGQADAQKVVKESGSLTPEYLQYIAITKWNGILPSVTGGVTPFIDVSGFAQQQTVPTH
jgi:regulator of protease activity HflC (stomatin/prohibitin superfamily)